MFFLSLLNVLKVVWIINSVALCVRCPGFLPKSKDMHVSRIKDTKLMLHDVKSLINKCKILGENMKVNFSVYKV